MGIDLERSRDICVERQNVGKQGRDDHDTKQFVYNPTAYLFEKIPRVDCSDM